MHDVAAVLQAAKARNDSPCRDTAATDQSCPCQPAADSVTTGVQLASAAGEMISHALSMLANDAAIRIRCLPRVRMAACPSFPADSFKTIERFAQRAKHRTRTP
jgi:hypothetical protein